MTIWKNNAYFIEKKQCPRRYSIMSPKVYHGGLIGGIKVEKRFFNSL